MKIIFENSENSRENNFEVPQQPMPRDQSLRHASTWSGATAKTRPIFILFLSKMPQFDARNVAHENRIVSDTGSGS